VTAVQLDKEVRCELDLEKPLRTTEQKAVASGEVAGVLPPPFRKLTKAFYGRFALGLFSDLRRRR